MAHRLINGWGVLLMLMACAPALAAPSQWQGTGPLPAQADDDPANFKPSEFIILDTGGTGGSFGKGQVRSKLTSVFFYDDRRGVACGIRGAYRTEDGGITWTDITDKNKANHEGIYYFIGMTGPEELWIAHGIHGKMGGHLWHSTNNGKTWNDAATRFPGKVQQVWNMLCHQQHIWLLGGGSFTHSYRSDDGGKTWKKLKVLPGKGMSHHRVAMPSSQLHEPLQTVYVLGGTRVAGKSGMTPCVARSDDAGKQWRPIALPDADQLPRGMHRYCMDFATPDIGAIGTEAGIILYTDDGGTTWQRRDLPGQVRFVQSLWLDPKQPGHLFASVWNGFDHQQGRPHGGVAVYESLDAGKNWVPVLSGKKQVNDFFGWDNHHLWGVGDVPGVVYNDLVMMLK